MKTIVTKNLTLRMKDMTNITPQKNVHNQGHNMK